VKTGLQSRAGDDTGLVLGDPSCLVGRRDAGEVELLRHAWAGAARVGRAELLGDMVQRVGARLIIIAKLGEFGAGCCGCGVHLRGTNASKCYGKVLVGVPH